MRYKITLEYDGTQHVGWQMQENGVSIQGRIHHAIERISGEHCIPRAAGRTDSGVHAIAQVAHIDMERAFTPYRLMTALNAYLIPHGICVLQVEPVADNFDARFSCTKRAYLYKIINRRSPLALDKHRAWHLGVPLACEAMRAGAQHLLGLHDFTTFRASQCQANSPIRTLDQLDIVQISETEIHIITSARAFLHAQVRSMVGSLVEVGLGRWHSDHIKTILEAKSRKACGSLAPACGLYFLRAEYEA